MISVARRINLAFALADCPGRPSISERAMTSSAGMFTSPKLTDPDQIALAMPLTYPQAPVGRITALDLSDR
jgi:hypothetical protein